MIRCSHVAPGGMCSVHRCFPRCRTRRWLKGRVPAPLGHGGRQPAVPECVTGDGCNQVQPTNLPSSGALPCPGASRRSRGSKDRIRRTCGLLVSSGGSVFACFGEMGWLLLLFRLMSCPSLSTCMLDWEHESSESSAHTCMTLTLAN